MVGLALLLILGLVIAAVRSPLVRRIGFRNATRRPREALLVMLGCVTGTALIVGSAAVGSSFTASIQDQALRQLGALDATVSYDTADNWAAGNRALVAAPVAGVAVATAATTIELPVTSDTSPDAAPTAKLIEVDYRRAGDLGAGEGFKPGDGPTAGTAWVSTTLAKTLNLKIDSVLTVHTGVPNQEFRVRKITASPLVTFVDGPTDSGDNLLVSPGTVDILRQQQPTGIAPRYLTLIVAQGPHTRTPPASAQVDALRDSLTKLLTPFNGAVTMVRHDNLENAKLAGDATKQFLNTIGTFGIVAGILLLVNVLLMLAEERLAELGTMRAVGLPRRPLIASFSVEGAVYAFVGSSLGGVVGALLGRIMVWLAAGSATRPALGGQPGLTIRFALSPTTVVMGIATGFVVAMIAVLGTSYRVSRLDVIRALRELPPTRRTRRRRMIALVVTGMIVGPLVSALGYATKATMPSMLGLPIALAGAAALIARRRDLDAALTFGCGLTILWVIFVQLTNFSAGSPPSVTVVGGMIVVLCGVLLLNAQQHRAAKSLRRIGGGRTAVTGRLGLANPVAHRVRTLLTVGPFALVIFTLVYSEGISNIISTGLNHVAPSIGGDYQVYADSSAAHPYNFARLAQANVTATARTSTILASWLSSPKGYPELAPVTAFDASLTKVAPPRLAARSAAYKTDAEAYRAVAKNPDLIVVPSAFLFRRNARAGLSADAPTEPAQLGDIFTITDPVSGKTRDVTVVGISYADVLHTGPFYGQLGARDLFGDRLKPTGAFLATSASPQQLVQQLQQAGIDNGVDARVIEAAAHDYFSFVNSLVNLYRSDLGVGLVVGIAGVGVVLVRSVRDRRRQIGTLRAMGLEAVQIQRSFLLEGAFIATQALLVGVGLGTVVVMTASQSPFIKEVLGYQPGVPMPSVSVYALTVILLGAALAASAGPARAASKIPPAVALRLVD